MFESAADRYGSGRGGHDSLLLSNMEAELQAWRDCHHHCTAAAVIHRVPPSMRVDLASVEPAVVSIGPYHQGKASLQPMEQNKWRALDTVLRLNRSRKLQDYLREMAALEMPARSCYDEDVAYMGSQEFAAMLLLDGCFLAVLFLGGDPSAGACRPGWFTPAVARDILLLENQIPFFVVRKIAEMACPALGSGRLGGSSSALAKRVAETLRDLMGLHANMPMDSAGLQVHHHLLHLLHFIFFRPVIESDAPEAASGSSEKAHPNAGSRPAGPRTMLSLLPSASVLQDAGVRLKKRKQRGVLDATFHDHTMQVPFLRVDRFTASLLQNLLAWESSHGGVGNGVAIYVLFMDRLVRTGRDAAVLADKGVLEHRLGGDGDVARLFDGLAAGVPLELDGGCYLKPMLQRVRKYQKSNLHKWRAWIKREFSGNEEFYLGLLLNG